MRKSAVWELAPSAGSGRVAAAMLDATVQVWDARTGEKAGEFASFHSYGGQRLALNAKGTRCAVANWRGGRRGGLAYYEVKSGRMLWHRTDISHAWWIRMSSNGESIYCAVEFDPVRRLDAGSGETLEELFDVEDVCDSPYSEHVLMACRGDVFVVEGPRGGKFARAPRMSPNPRYRPHFVTASAFGKDCLCVAESWVTAEEPVVAVRCVDYAGVEIWRSEVQPPGTISALTYRKRDGCFYGVEWDCDAGTYCYLVRYSKKGESSRISRLSSPEVAFCLHGEIVLTPDGAVKETPTGKTVRRLRFPKTE